MWTWHRSCINTHNCTDLSVSIATADNPWPTWLSLHPLCAVSFEDSSPDMAQFTVKWQRPLPPLRTSLPLFSLFIPVSPLPLPFPCLMLELPCTCDVWVICGGVCGYRSCVVASRDLSMWGGQSWWYSIWRCTVYITYTVHSFILMGVDVTDSMQANCTDLYIYIYI